MIHRASGLGSCLKGQIAAALGMKPIPVDEASQLRMNEGAIHEDDVVARLTADGYTVTRQQEEVNLDFHWAKRAGSELHQGDARVQGHLDGVLYPNASGSPYYGGARVLEIKSMGDTPFKAFKQKGWDAGGLIDRYKWQISVYMIATGLEAYVVAKNRNSGELLRHGIEVPFHSLDEITERVAYIEDHVTRGVLPDECDNDWFCPYKYLCGKPREEDGAEHSSDERIPLEVVAYYDLGQQITGLEAQRKELRPTVEAFLAGRKTVVADGYRVTWVEQTIPERVQKASTRSFPKITKVGDDDATEA